MLKVLKDAFDVLTFRFTRETILNFGYAHLAVGLFLTWLVGMGRYWDNPKVGFLQHLGVGSLIYIFALALLIWLLVMPLKPKDWTYFRVLTFISLVSPPAVLYAIPVQFYTDIDTANSTNLIFLGIVSIWRVALLVVFLHRYALLNKLVTAVACLLPITLIVVVLTYLNLDRVVFDIMGGGGERSPNDAAYDLLVVITVFSTFAFPVILAGYIVAVIIVNTKNHNESTNSKTE